MQCEVSCNCLHITQNIANYIGSISTSPKGWTDQELGSAWLERDLEPETLAKNKTSGYRLLILDVHNSHTTYRFCSFVEKHKIIVLCLPAHTTHRLQPCDVGVFGPLNSTCKAKVNKASAEWIPIRKTNLLVYYSRACEKAFTEETIRSAFHKTGIFPFNPDAIEADALAPALNTTTQSAQPIPARLPDLLEPVTTAAPISVASTTTTSSSTALTSVASLSTTTQAEGQGMASDAEIRYILKHLPPELSGRASCEDHMAQNAKLRYLLDRCCYQMQRDFALKKLMDTENEWLRKRLFEKSKKHTKKLTSGLA